MRRPVAAATPFFSMRNRSERRRGVVPAMERVAREVDSRDPSTYEHSRRVAEYAGAIARRLRFSRAEVELLQLAARVHDIGKIGIPDAILLKPAPLTDSERCLMEAHARLGFEILARSSVYANVLDLVLAHHERYDGRGYPDGAIGHRMLLIAQVIPVADALDAMTSSRAYRMARSWGWAMGELRSGAGTQWNPIVVEAALFALDSPPWKSGQVTRPAAVPA